MLTEEELQELEPENQEALDKEYENFDVKDYMQFREALEAEEKANQMAD